MKIKYNVIIAVLSLTIIANVYAYQVEIMNQTNKTYQRVSLMMKGRECYGGRGQVEIPTIPPGVRKVCFPDQYTYVPEIAPFILDKVEAESKTFIINIQVVADPGDEDLQTFYNQFEVSKSSIINDTGTSLNLSQSKRCFFGFSKLQIVLTGNAAEPIQLSVYDKSGLELEEVMDLK